MKILFTIMTSLFLSLFINQSVSAAAVQVQTSVSDNVVYLGDMFTLTIEINDSSSDYQLDTRPLEKDFTVYRPSRSQKSELINGKFSQRTEWQVTLQAKAVGTFTIPALKIGSLNSKAIVVSVEKPSAEATKSQDNAVFIENSVDRETLYLGQPLIFTSKIFLSQNSNELNLLDPTLKGADIEVYGEDKNGQTIRNGIRYKTITRKYQINANTAGNVTINSPLLTGSLRKTVRISDWQNRVIADPINIRGDSLKVTIKEKPADYQGEWLISDDVRLIENQSIDGQSFRVGEPITRSISLQVASINKDKLPVVNFNYPKSLRFYPDQDELIEGQANDLIYAQRTLRHAIIPDQAGSLTLPEIKIPWWNSLTDKQEFAVLPAQTLTILAAEKTHSSAADTEAPQTIPTAAAPQEAPAAAAADNSALIMWQVISAILLFSLIVLAAYHYSYRRKSAAEKISSPLIAPLKQELVTLNNALHKQDAGLIYQALLSYAQSEYHLLKSLSQLPDCVNLNEQDKQLLAAEIKKLENRCCNPSSAWNAEQLSQLIKKHQQHNPASSGNNIMDINP
ncbi:BatD family protein [Psychromonas ossibalaenae]|uniref:BatD family protein n=1 Tax=Psychromonas ossibalaenae TaxID=444922 RepID=UPI0003642002|nr:BatD family protein [Psychromonas ossibalaenae]